MYMLRMDVCVCVLLRCVCVCAHTTRVHKCVRVRARIEVYVCTHMGVVRLGEVVAYDRERHRHEDAYIHMYTCAHIWVSRALEKLLPTIVSGIAMKTTPLMIAIDVTALPECEPGETSPAGACNIYICVCV